MACRFLLVLCTCMLQLLAAAQDCPPNLDFEGGNFNNWQCFIGTTTSDGVKNNIQLNPSDPAPGRHEIISAATALKKDKYGNFPTLCPYGGKYSVKLGNESVGHEAEGISYTLTVPTTVDTFTFTYFYAVVFQDPQHLLPQQPRFFVTAYDVATGLVVNCASYDYVSQSSIPGFEVSPISPQVLYKDWTPASLQFAGMQGRQVRLEFKTADCTPGAHFGYAYLDVGSGCSNILASAPYCIETNSLTLNAPYGFKNYTWYNPGFNGVVGRSRTITFSPPPVTAGTFYVDVEPYPGYGCRDTFTATVKPLPVPDLPTGPSEFIFCQYGNSTPLEATTNGGAELWWYTAATGGTGSSRAPRPSTAVAGDFFYWVSQQSLFGCESLRKKIKVRVLPTPTAAFSINTVQQCQNGNAFVFTSNSGNLNSAIFNWSFGDGTKIGSDKDTVARYTYTNAGNFMATLTVSNGGSCSASATQAVTVVPKPIASFIYPALICQNTTLVQLQDRSVTPTTFTPVTQWWWLIDGVVATGAQPPSFIATQGGNVTVKQVVTTAGGCYSDTNTVLVPVRYQPVAAFATDGLMCNNEIVTFNSTSTVPGAAAGESLAQWHWNIGSAGYSGATQAVVLSAGKHKVSLRTQTAYGCSSLPKDTVVEIFEKPVTSVYLSDSCALRAITFTATDHSGSVQQWAWRINNTPQPATTTLTKNYRAAGTHTLVIQTQTNKGCRDTLLRPFTVYDNTAFAGRDTVAAWDEPVQLNAGGYPQTRFNWRPALGLNSDSVGNPVATLDRDQQYRMFAVTKEGCDASSTINIKRFKGPQLYIPTAFTPNKDGRNDALRVLPVGVKKFHYFAVYDRWGGLVFKTTDASKGWDGTVNGQAAASGYFIALAEATDYKGRPLKYKGAVLLIR